MVVILKIMLWIVVLIWAVFELIRSTIRYRKEKDKLDLISLIATAFMIPAELFYFWGRYGSAK
jgi:hypothetical protein